MVPITQLEIDTAVLKIKTMQYKLNWELVKEEQYGGDTSCCMTRLKLLWLWRRTLSCQKQKIKATGKISVNRIAYPGNTVTYQVLVNGVAISDNLSHHISGPSPGNVVAILTDIVNSINSYQSVYVAGLVSNGSDSYIILIGRVTNLDIISYNTTGIMIFDTVQMTNAVTGGCLTDEKIKDLIGDINIMCK